VTLSDGQFIEQFESLELDPEHFDHLGHLRLAWLYLRRYPLAEAIERTTSGIETYADSLGATDKFRHTLTEAVVRIMAQRMAVGQADTLDDFLADNPDLLQDLPGVLATHYSPETLRSEAARHGFVPPDRSPLEA
jgi:hypothetical protein